MIAGVAGGMAESWDLDPSIVRVGWVLLAILSLGVFLLIYIAMAVVVPIRPDGYPVAEGPGPGRPGVPPAGPSRPGGAAPVIGGVVLILIGVWFLVRDYLDIDVGRLWPLIVIALGALLIVLAFVRPRRR
jgi:phage shock protein PspC (stress-responsive transcriptional regulator)